MKHAPANRVNALLALSLAAALPGCISFSPKPPPSLLTLQATAGPAVGASQSSAEQRSIVVLAPTVPAALASQRIPVQVTPTTLAYIKGAQWVEPPARLFARLVADTVTARAGMVVLSGVQSLSDPSATLGGELRMFGADAGASSAIVTYDATLIRPNQTRVEKRRFSARVPVAAIDPGTMGPALNEAANQVAAQVADWVKQP